MNSRTASRPRKRKEVIHILSDDEDAPIYIDGKAVETIDLSKSDGEDVNPRPSKKRRVTLEQDNKNGKGRVERMNSRHSIGSAGVNGKGKNLWMIDLSQSSDEEHTLLPGHVKNHLQTQHAPTSSQNLPKPALVKRIPPPARDIQPLTRPNIVALSRTPQYRPSSPQHAITSNFVGNPLHQQAPVPVDIHFHYYAPYPIYYHQWLAPYPYKYGPAHQQQLMVVGTSYYPPTMAPNMQYAPHSGQLYRP